MNKKLLLFIITCVFAIVLSGCAKYSTDIEITNKDEVNISQTVLLNLDFYKTLDSGFESENPHKNWNYLFDSKTEDKYRSKNYQVTDIADEKYIGKKFIKSFKHIKFFFSDSLPEGYSTPEGSDMPIVIKKNPFGATYSINMIFKPERLKTVSKDIYPQAMYDDVTAPYLEKNDNNEDLIKPSITLKIKIPKEASRHNATFVDTKNNVYIWDFSDTLQDEDGENFEIVLEYKTTNFTSIIIFAIIMIMIFVVIIRNKKYNDMKSDETKGAF